MTAIRTLVADKQTLFVEGLKAILNSENPDLLDFVNVVDSSEQLFNSLETQNVEFLIMDLNLSDKDGLDIIPAIRSLYKDLRIAVITSYGDYKFVKDALMKGANGYMLKSNNKDDLVTCISNVFNDETYIGPGLHITPPKDMLAFRTNGAKSSIYEDRFMIRRKLTNREQEVLTLIAQAKNNREIAEELFISDQTVGVHRKNIMRKLGVRNTVNLIKFALEHQLV